MPVDNQRLMRAVTLSSGLVFMCIGWVMRDMAFTDMRILHLGADLIADGRAADAYDPRAFAEASSVDPYLAERLGALGVFFSTPAFAFAFQPLTWLSPAAAVAVWTCLGIVAVFVAVKVLELPPIAGFAVLLMPSGIVNLLLAQTGFLVLLWAAVIHRLCANGRTVPAGLVAGLAVLKPPLLLGVAVWWLVDWRRWYPALLAASAVGAAVIGPTLVNGFGQWREFFRAFEARAAVEGEITHNQATLGELLLRLTNTAFATHPATQLAILAVGGGVLRWLSSRWEDRLEWLSGAAMIMSILISPHLLIYDTPLLLIPFAIALRAGVPSKALDRLVAIIVTTSLFSAIPYEPLGSINDVVMLTTIGLLAAGAIWFRALEETGQDVATVGHIEPTVELPNAA